jgi:hypothetical protein
MPKRRRHHVRARTDGGLSCRRPADAWTGRASRRDELGGRWRGSEFRARCPGSGKPDGPALEARQARRIISGSGRILESECRGAWPPRLTRSSVGAVPPGSYQGRRRRPRHGRMTGPSHRLRPAAERTMSDTFSPPLGRAAMPEKPKRSEAHEWPSRIASRVFWCPTPEHWLEATTGSTSAADETRGRLRDGL